MVSPVCSHFYTNASGQVYMPDEQKPTGNGNRSAPNQPRNLPDFDICRAKESGFGAYCDCLVSFPFECKHALHFGSGVLCLHPQRREIVARTKPL